MPKRKSLSGTISQLPVVNASLNALAAVLLIAGLVLIKNRRERAHMWTMLTAFATSVIFLACYLTYHTYRQYYEGVGHTRFQGPATISYVYYTILISHVILAATVPFLAIATIYLGLRDRRTSHRRLARWTLPIWLYVSITGVVVYWMLYHLYPAETPGSIIR